MTDIDRDTDDAGEYVRYRMQIQRGDGPDRRGKVEVEMQREHPEARQDRDAEEVVLPDGRTIAAQVDNAAFASFFHETDRALTLLEERLGLGEE